MDRTGSGSLLRGVPLVEVWRGEMLESVHLGHAAVVRPDGEVVAAWGEPALTVYPRSACKMLQALPLVEAGLESAPRRLALACASHNGAAIHLDGVTDWLRDLGLGESDLRCGSHVPRDGDESRRLVLEGEAPDQRHNNCSGKHTGFLALTKHLGADAEYVDPTHPVQRAVRAAFEETTGETSPGFAIDGCSAPNFATSLRGLARAMARFAAASGDGDGRDRAMHALRTAMIAHPDLVAGEGRACTALMRAMRGIAVKTGAEGVFVAMLPETPQGPLGVAVKAADGATRAAETAIAALLVGLGALDPGAPAAKELIDAPIRNWRGTVTGAVRPAEGLRGH